MGVIYHEGLELIHEAMTKMALYHSPYCKAVCIMLLKTKKEEVVYTMSTS